MSATSFTCYLTYSWNHFVDLYIVHLAGEHKPYSGGVALEDVINMTGLLPGSTRGIHYSPADQGSCPAYCCGVII